MKLNSGLATLVLTVALVLLLPQTGRAQGFVGLQEGIALDGTRLTYYPRPSMDDCKSDCANNPGCQGFTWIQAGTYNATDAAMCYLLSAVTGKAPAGGHISAVKGTAGTTSQ